MVENSGLLKDRWESFSPVQQHVALLIASQIHIRGVMGNDDIVPICNLLTERSSATREDVVALYPSVEILPDGSSIDTLRKGEWKTNVCDGVRLTQVEDYEFLLEEMERRQHKA